MHRWDPSLPLRALGQLGPAARAVCGGVSLAPGTGPADAIVVLGALVLPGGQPSGSLRARVEAAVRLYHRGVAPLVVATGASHGQPPGEAVVARGLLLEGGVPPERILVEEKSHDTRGNLLYARALLRPPLDRIYVVTEPFHIARACRLARDVGFDPLPWPVDSPAWRRPASRARLLLRDTLSMSLLLAGA